MNEQTHPWREDLGAYLVGALDADESARMRRHLEECAECREEYAQLTPVVGILARIPVEALSADPASPDASGTAAPADEAGWERLRARAGLAGTGGTGAGGTGAGAIASAGGHAGAYGTGAGATTGPGERAGAYGTGTGAVASPGSRAGAGTGTSASAGIGGAGTRRRPSWQPRPNRSPGPPGASSAPGASGAGERPGGRGKPRRARRPLHPTAVAALSGALVAAVAFGVYAGVDNGGGNGTTTAAGTETVSAADAATGVSGTVQYRPTNWGSWVQITLKGVKPGDDCVLYALDRAGDKAVASTWWAPYPPGGSATIPGGVSMQASDIKTFQVTTTVGDVLLTIPTG